MYQSFGSDEIRNQFGFAATNTEIFLNHGSYGRSPKCVMETRFKLISEQEEKPDVWFRISMNKYYNKAVQAAAEFIDSDFEDTFIVDNTTSGINYVLKSLKFEPSAEILLTSHTYRAVQNTAEEIEGFNGLKRTYIHLSFPIENEDQIVEMYEKKFIENMNIKIAVIDQITSPSAVLLPIKKLVDLCRKYSVLSVIDGAHGPGQVQVSMKYLEADFYAGNFHKWAFASRSCAVLWVSPSFRGKILPLVTSNYRDSLHQMYAYMGTRDDSSFYTLSTALQFYEDIGGLETATAYTEQLLQWAQTLICDALGTQPLGVLNSMRAPCMAVLKMPELPPSKKKFNADQLTVQFWLDYSIQTCFTQFSDTIWLRMSASVYNRKKDFLKLKDALLDFYEINK